MPPRPSIRRKPLAAAAALPLAAVLAGCGAHGQPAALEACKAFTNATTGYVTPAQRDAGLADAERWAGKAIDKGPQWQTLLDALHSYQTAVDSPKASTAPVRHRLRDASDLIQNSCELAASGY